MKRKIDFKIPIIVILTIILVIMCYFYFKEDNNYMQPDISKNSYSIKENSNNNEIATSSDIITTTAEVSSGLTENIQLHAIYYLEEIYIQTNQLVKAGENILKYTNGIYLTAPYDCVVTEINIPDIQGKCTNEHYVKISSNNNLIVKFSVDETNINSISLGQTAQIQISAYENKVIEGVVTNISNTASNGKFTITVEFENDGEIMMGMTATVTI